MIERSSSLSKVVEVILNRLESPRSVQAATHELHDFLGFCKNQGVDPLAPARGLVSAYVANTRGRWAPLTRRRALSTIRQLYQEAITQGLYAGPNPTLNVARIKGQAVSDPPALTADETRALIRYADEKVLGSVALTGPALRAKRDRLAIHLFLYCGLRCAELVGLRWEDRQKVGAYRVLKVLGKGNEAAFVKVSASLDTMLGAYRDAVVASGILLRDSDPVFFGYVTLNGAWPPSIRRAGGVIQPWSTRAAARMVDAALAAIGRDGSRTSPHLLRRTSGTFVYERTGDIYMAQRHLRHASAATTTKHYVRLHDPLKDAGIDHLDFTATEKADES